MNTKRPRRRSQVAVSLGTIAAVLALGWCGHGVLGQSDSIDIEQIAQRDLYAVLELQPGATDADVKAAYRTLARRWHPDKNPDDTQAAQGKFADIAEAYDILSDGTTRQLYDHARRVRAAHDARGSANDGRDGGGLEGGGGSPEAGGWAAAEGDWFYYHGGAMDDGARELYGSSFDGGVGFDFGDRVTFGVSSSSRGDLGGAETGGGAGLRGRGAFEFRASDPIELFEALFGGGGIDGADIDSWQQQDHYQGQEWHWQEALRWRDQQQHFWHGSGRVVEGGGGVPWIGQDFEQYHDFEDGGVMYRRVITTVVFGDGSAQSTAQDYAFDKASERWVIAGAPFDYRGPGVAPAGPAGRSCGGRGDEAVDNVLRMNEFLRVGHGIFSVDRKFSAVLEGDCNFVVLRHRGPGKPVAKVWETGSFDAGGECYATIQDNGIFIVMAGADPTVTGNVLWSNNQGHVGWFTQRSFHAAVMPNGNLVISQGESPLHPDARMCLWGAFGCPGDGGVMEWKQVWMSFRSKAGIIWCKVVGCGWEVGNDSSGSKSNDHHRDRFDKKDGEGGIGGFRWNGGDDWLAQSAAALRSAVGRGMAALKEALSKLKAAAEDTAHAASRPRHW